QGPVILQGPRIEGTARRRAPNMRAIDPNLELEVLNVKKFLVDGEFALEEEGAVLGVNLAQALGVGVGDVVTVYSPGNLDAIFEELDQLDRIENDPEHKEAVERLRSMVLPAELVVRGIFRTGRMLYDSEFFLVPLFVGQELYDLQDGIHGFTARTQDPYRVGIIQERLFKTLPDSMRVHTWIDMNRDRFEAIRLERSVMFFLLFFIVLVAAFGIMNTLITVTVQKTREIGIMKALGATTGQVVWVFLSQGMVVGLFGTVCGLASGMWLVQFRNQVRDWLSQILGIQVFPQAIYEFAEIPAEVVPSDVAVICGGAFLICTLAALFPAWFASRLDPVKALRHE
ncbi:MAG: FtsX-like permease family protein, partial [Verrucomicrobiia bacterium]